MRGPRDWAALLAAVGTLTLGAIAARGIRRDPLARAIAALCFGLFGWNFAVVAQRVVHSARAFEILDSVCSSLSPPLVLEVVLAFVGGAARHRGARIGAWSAFGALAVASVYAVDAPVWAGAFLVSWIFAFAYEVVVLAQYLRRATDPRERARARIVLAALAIGGAASTSDLAHAVGLPAPYLGAAGTFVASALLLTLVVRLDLLERRVTARTTLYVLAMISAAIAAYLVVLSAFAERVGVQLLFVCLLTLAGAAVARELALELADERARTQRLALVGRFSAQMTHDIRAPLTAMLGAAQLLEGENGLKNGSESNPASAEYLALVTEQAKRVAAIVDRYDRMARIEPRCTLVSLNEVTNAVARAQGVECELTTDEPELEADRALLESSLENIIKNAVEAAGNAGLVRIDTRVSGGHAIVRVIDHGPGMDPRVLARATEDFFTTKANGSGLGLTFAQRVVEAHGGRLTIESRPGQGTTVTVSLAVQRVAQSASRIRV